MTCWRMICNTSFVYLNILRMDCVALLSLCHHPCTALHSTHPPALSLHCTTVTVPTSPLPSILNILSMSIVMLASMVTICLWQCGRCLNSLHTYHIQSIFSHLCFIILYVFSLKMAFSLFFIIFILLYTDSA